MKRIKMAQKRLSEVPLFITLYLNFPKVTPDIISKFHREFKGMTAKPVKGDDYNVVIKGTTMLDDFSRIDNFMSENSIMLVGLKFFEKEKIIVM